MQMKLIALAVAGLVSVPAFAQSNVTIYGIVDMGYVYRGDNVVDGVKNRNGIDSGIANGSRLGFKGTEDLGSGMKAGFVLEQGIAADTGTSTQGGRTFGRQSFAYLGGNFGTVALGRQYAPQFILLDSMDPFSTGQVGASNNIYGIDVRLDNLVSYTSPNWNGFNVVAGYTFSAAGNESRGNNSTLLLAETTPTVINWFGDARVWVINPNYKNGPLQVGVNYHQVTLKAADSVGGVTNDLAFGDGKKVKVWDIGGSYDLGVVKLAAMFGQRKADSDLIGDFTFNPFFKKSTQWLVGATVPVGPSGKVLLSYAHRKSELTADAADLLGTSSDAKSGQWALGYEYALSKRTSMYTAYSDINNKGSAKDNLGLSASVGDATSDGGGYQRGFNLGLRHVF